MKLSERTLRVHQYWLEKGIPENYLNVSDNRSEYLVKLVQEHMDTSASFLEIGCNVGRNLNGLFQSGYKNLAGIEIQPKAITLMKKAYSEMARSTQIWIVPIEEVIKDFKDNSFDLVFTMATLMHIHYDSNFIFAEVARITRRFLILTEREGPVRKKQTLVKSFPRFYRPIFEKFGMVQIYEERIKREKGILYGPKKKGKVANFWTRIFEKREKKEGLY